MQEGRPGFPDVIVLPADAVAAMTGERADGLSAGYDGTPIVLEGGDCAVGIESTIVDLCGATPRILRPGRISAAQLAQGIGPVEAGPTIRAWFIGMNPQLDDRAPAREGMALAA